MKVLSEGAGTTPESDAANQTSFLGPAPMNRGRTQVSKYESLKMSHFDPKGLPSFRDFQQSTSLPWMTALFDSKPDIKKSMPMGLAAGEPRYEAQQTINSSSAPVSVSIGVK